MTYVLRDVRDGTYVSDRCIQKIPDLNDARLFAEPRHAHSCSDYRPAFHELVAVEVVPVASQPTIRKGEWLTEQEYQDQFDGPFYHPGDTLVTQSQYGYDVVVSPHPIPLQHPFQVLKGQVFQAVMIDYVWKGNGYSKSSQGCKMLPVYPAKEAFYNPRSKYR